MRAYEAQARGRVAIYIGRISHAICVLYHDDPLPTCNKSHTIPEGTTGNQE